MGICLYLVVHIVATIRISWLLIITAQIQEQGSAIHFLLPYHHRSPHHFALA